MHINYWLFPCLIFNSGHLFCGMSFVCFSNLIAFLRFQITTQRDLQVAIDAQRVAQTRYWSDVFGWAGATAATHANNPTSSTTSGATPPVAASSPAAPAVGVSAAPAASASTAASTASEERPLAFSYKKILPRAPSQPQSSPSVEATSSSNNQSTAATNLTAATTSTNNPSGSAGGIAPAAAPTSSSSVASGRPTANKANVFPPPDYKPIRRPASPKEPRHNSDFLFVNVKRRDPETMPACNCKKSRCLKMYCDCFTQGVYCYGCNCAGCCNTEEKEPSRAEAVATVLMKRPNAFFHARKAVTVSLLVCLGPRGLDRCFCYMRYFTRLSFIR
jgi:hypothetical protein